jgi:hypothetical protein
MRSVLLIALLLAGCASVRQSDLDAWAGRPVSDLDKHPVFLTMPVVRTVASDGTEIRNYVNGRSITTCSRSRESGLSNVMDSGAYNRVTTCLQTHSACQNIFHITGGVVMRYTPIGTGGARCFTDERARPDFAGAANIR